MIYPVTRGNYIVYGNSISIDQAGKPPAKGTWIITNGTLEINTSDENQKKSKLILRKLSKE